MIDKPLGTVHGALPSQHHCLMSNKCLMTSNDLIATGVVDNLRPQNQVENTTIEWYSCTQVVQLAVNQHQDQESKVR